MKRKIIAAFLAVCMMASSVQGVALAAPTQTVEAVTERVMAPTLATEATSSTTATLEKRELPEGVSLSEIVGAETETNQQGGYRQVPFDMPLVDNGAEDGITPYGATIPSSYDNSSKLPEPRDQNPYGTCWSFAAMAAAEGGMIFQKDQVDGKTAGDSIDLSEYQLARFMYFNVDDPMNNTTSDATIGMNSNVDITGDEPVGGDSYLNLGGNNMFATWVMAGWKAGADESAAPYSSIEETEGVLDKSIAYKDKVHMQNAYWISMEQPELVKQAIMEYGVVACSYMHDYYEAYNEETYAYFTDGYMYSGGGHAISIVGWDDDFSKDNFVEGRQPLSDGAWLVRNSWGSSWGRDGYFWISYEEPSLDAQAMVFDFEDADNYDYNYQYDGSSGTRYLQNLQDCSVSNVFKVKGADSQLLEAVSIGLASADTEYSLQIYLNPTTGNPTSGTPMLSKPQTGTATYAGYHTIELNQPVDLKAGQTFAVVFTFETNAKVFVDMTYANGDWIRFVSETQSNQSFLTDNYYGETYDLSDEFEACARIKAFTNSVSKKVVKAQPGKDGSITYYEDGAVSETKTIYAPKTVKLSYTEKACTGSATYPTVKGVYDRQGNLIASSNYTVSYSNKKSKIPGTYSVTVTFKGDYYTGKLTQKYKLKVNSAENLKIASATTNALKITWKKNANADGHELYAATKKNGKYKKIATLKGSATSYTYKKLTGAKNYFFKLKTYTKIGSKKYYATSSILYGATKPGKVSVLKASNQATTSVKLSWKKVSGATGYEVQRYNSSKKKWEKVATVSSKANKYTNKNLKAGTTYKYRVRAIRKNGSYIAGGAYSGVVTTSTKPAKVQSLQATATGKNYVTLKWKKVTGASGYEVYVYNSSSKKYEKAATIAKGSTVSKKMTSLKKGTTYKYKVRAYKKVGSKVLYGGFSNVKSVKTKK